MRKIVKLAMGSTLLLMLAQCGGNGSGAPTTGGKLCNPAEVRTCVGTAACAGEQMCSGDGTRWSDCVCKGASADASVDFKASGASAQYTLIDDMEGTSLPNGPILLPVSGASLKPGYWVSWHSTGSTSNTMAPNPFTYVALPLPHQTMDGVTSLHATHMVCSISDLYGNCGESFWPAQETALVASPEAGGGAPLARVPYDLSAYHVLVFWGRSSRANRVKVLFNNADMDPIAGRCGQSDASAVQCWDAFSKDVTLTDSWQRYEVKLKDLFQDGWGFAAADGKFDTTTISSIGFQVNGPQNEGA
ncbi:MAG TPA: hypothetical protein VIM14_15310, partial [Polyangia bacterium]